MLIKQAAMRNIAKIQEVWNIDISLISIKTTCAEAQLGSVAIRPGATSLCDLTCFWQSKT